MQTCNLFDRYRDDELSADERNEFELHCAVCERCRTKMALLNNLVCVLKQNEAQMPMVDLAAKIAERAFRQTRSWDALVVSWIKLGPALAALALVLVLFTFLWLGPNYQPINAFSEYETLMEEADAINLEMSVSEVRNDSELVIWLAQESSFK